MSKHTLVLVVVVVFLDVVLFPVLVLVLVVVVVFLDVVLVPVLVPVVILDVVLVVVSLDIVLVSSCATTGKWDGVMMTAVDYLNVFHQSAKMGVTMVVDLL